MVCKVDGNLQLDSCDWSMYSTILNLLNRGENQALVGAIPYCGEYPGPRFEDKFRSANQIDGISKAGEIKWLPVNL